MDERWRERERLSLAAERRLLAALGAVFGVLTVGGFMVASLVALVVGAIGATLVVGRLQHLRVAERLLAPRDH